MLSERHPSAATWFCEIEKCAWLFHGAESALRSVPPQVHELKLSRCVERFTRDDARVAMQPLAWIAERIESTREEPSRFRGAASRSLMDSASSRARDTPCVRGRSSSLLRALEVASVFRCRCTLLRCAHVVVISHTPQRRARGIAFVGYATRAFRSQRPHRVSSHLSPLVILRAWGSTLEDAGRQRRHRGVQRLSLRCRAGPLASRPSPLRVQGVGPAFGPALPLCPEPPRMTSAGSPCAVCPPHMRPRARSHTQRNRRTHNRRSTLDPCARTGQ